MEDEEDDDLDVVVFEEVRKDYSYWRNELIHSSVEFQLELELIKNSPIRRELAMLQELIENDENGYSIDKIIQRKSWFFRFIWKLNSISMHLKLNQNNKKTTMHKPIGLRLTPLLQTIFSKNIFESIFAQQIADARDEYFEALSDGKLNLARWRQVQLYLRVILTVLSLITASSAKKFISMWKIL